MFVALTWRTPLANFRINERQLWTPTLSFLNDDSLEISAPTPTFYPHTGIVRQIVTIDGLISQDFNLRIFPWDVSDVSFHIVANLNETGTVRLFWDNRRDIVRATPKYINETLTEWHCLEEYNSLQRLAYSKHNHLYGKYNGVQFTVVLARNIWYYVVKILSIVVILNIISWGVFRMREDPEIITVLVRNSSNYSDGSGRWGGGGGGWGGGGGRLLRTFASAANTTRRETDEGGVSTGSEKEATKEVLGPPDIYVGAERYSERLEMIAGILLACVAFQYVIDDSLPKLGILTTMDWLLMSSYIQLFAMSVATVFVHDFSLDGSNLGRSLDRISAIVCPLLYFGMQSLHILHAVCMRSLHLAKWRDQAGVSPNMLRKNVVSAERMKTYSMIKKSKNSIKERLQGAARKLLFVQSYQQTRQMRDKQLEMQAIGELCFGGAMFGGDNDKSGELRERKCASDDGSSSEANSSKYKVNASDDRVEKDGGTDVDYATKTV